MKKLSFIILAALAQSALAHGTERTALMDCVIQQPLPGKDMTGAFLRIHHHGAAVEITGAEIPSVTPTVELHSMEMKDGVMSMIPLTNHEITEGDRLFKKGADHLMLMKIPADKLPKAGEKHQVTVHFKDAAENKTYSASCEAEVKTVEAIIEAQGGDAHAHHAHHHGHGHGHQPATTSQK